MSVINWECRVEIPEGIHCRVATSLAKIAAEHDTQLHIIQKDEQVDCTSILDVLSMALVHGSQVCFTAQGGNIHGVSAAVTNLLSGNGGS